MSDQPYSAFSSDVADYLPVDGETSYASVLSRIETRLSDLKRFNQNPDALLSEGAFTPAEAAFAHILAELMRLERLGGYRISTCLEAMIRAYKV